MKKLTVPLLVTMALVSVSCSDDVESKGPYEGSATHLVEVISPDFYQAPDTTVLILNASKVSCDSAETVEKVPCSSTPVERHSSYQLSFSDGTTNLLIATRLGQYDYTVDKKVRTWGYHPGEYMLNTAGYEKCAKFANVYKAIIKKDNLAFNNQIYFIRKNGDKDEVAFVTDAGFTHIEIYNIKETGNINLGVSNDEFKVYGCTVTTRKEGKHHWIIPCGEEEYRFNGKTYDFEQTKPEYTYLCKLRPAD